METVGRYSDIDYSNTCCHKIHEPWRNFAYHVPHLLASQLDIICFFAIVDRQIEPSNGNFVIAFVDGEFTIKQFKIDESGTFGWLIPWNKAYSPIRVDETNRFMIWGVVTYVIHRITE